MLEETFVSSLALRSPTVNTAFSLFHPVVWARHFDILGQVVSSNDRLSVYTALVTANSLERLISPDLRGYWRQRPRMMVAVLKNRLVFQSFVCPLGCYCCYCFQINRGIVVVVTPFCRCYRFLLY